MLQGFVFDVPLGPSILKKAGESPTQPELQLKERLPPSSALSSFPQQIQLYSRLLQTHTILESDTCLP